MIAHHVEIHFPSAGQGFGEVPRPGVRPGKLASCKRENIHFFLFNGATKAQMWELLPTSQLSSSKNHLSLIVDADFFAS
uniref:Uncharacterized protein n=1 Tax=Ixodes ricinus TaxID=34613 RepID=A0A6B0U5X2_IXORI